MLRPFPLPRTVPGTAWLPYHSGQRGRRLRPQRLARSPARNTTSPPTLGRLRPWRHLVVDPNVRWSALLHDLDEAIAHPRMAFVECLHGGRTGLVECGEVRTPGRELPRQSPASGHSQGWPCEAALSLTKGRPFLVSCDTLRVSIRIIKVRPWHCGCLPTHGAAADIYAERDERRRRRNASVLSVLGTNSSRSSPPHLPGCRDPLQGIVSTRAHTSTASSQTGPARRTRPGRPAAADEVRWILLFHAGAR